LIEEKNPDSEAGSMVRALTDRLVTDLFQQRFRISASIIIFAKAAGLSERLSRAIMVLFNADAAGEVKPDHRASPGIIAVARHLVGSIRAAYVVAGVHPGGLVGTTGDEARCAGSLEKGLGYQAISEPLQDVRCGVAATCIACSAALEALLNARRADFDRELL
jgi:hypothetical protein